jgi:hypothetical protein
LTGFEKSFAGGKGQPQGALRRRRAGRTAGRVGAGAPRHRAAVARPAGRAATGRGGPARASHRAHHDAGQRARHGAGGGAHTRLCRAITQQCDERAAAGRDVQGDGVGKAPPPPAIESHGDTRRASGQASPLTRSGRAGVRPVNGGRCRRATHGPNAGGARTASRVGPKPGRSGQSGCPALPPPQPAKRVAGRAVGGAGGRGGAASSAQAAGDGGAGARLAALRMERLRPPAPPVRQAARHPTGGTPRCNGRRPGQGRTSWFGQAKPGEAGVRRRRWEQASGAQAGKAAGRRCEGGAGGASGTELAEWSAVPAVPERARPPAPARREGGASLRRAARTQSGGVRQPQPPSGAMRSVGGWAGWSCDARLGTSPSQPP